VSLIIPAARIRKCAESNETFIFKFRIANSSLITPSGRRGRERERELDVMEIISSEFIGISGNGRIKRSFF
jgi:hypothetical protein